MHSISDKAHGRKFLRRCSTLTYQEKEDGLFCLICKSTLVNVLRTEIGCKFCQACLDHLERCEKYCPRYNDLVKTISSNVKQDKFIRRNVFDLKIRCLNVRCKCECHLQDLSQHLEVCEYRENKCERCGDLYMYTDRMEHEGIQCKMIMTKCDQCGSEMSMRDLNAIYRNEMGNKGYVCNNCKGVCPLGCCEEIQENVKMHLGMCPRLTVECMKKELGCRYTFPRNDMNPHVETIIMLLMRLITEKIVRIQKEKADLNLQQVISERTNMMYELKQLVEELSSKVQTLVNLDNPNSLTPCLVQKSDFGDFKLHYGKVSRLIRYSLLHGITDKVELTLDGCSLFPEIILSSILTLDYWSEEVSHSISARQISTSPDKNQSIIGVKWDKAKCDFSLHCDGVSHNSKMTMADFIKAYNAEEDLALDIEIFQATYEETSNIGNA